MRVFIEPQETDAHSHNVRTWMAVGTKVIIVYCHNCSVYNFSDDICQRKQDIFCVCKFTQS